ncbi:MAG: cupin domain-containing protein [Hyphomonadaceae bacterium]|nr:cupin domain-containing protein [Hyphomonadaceae bacterium]
MSRSFALIAATLSLGACATMESVIGEGEPRVDPTLEAIQNARIRECPPGRTLENGRIGSDNESRGVTTEEIGTVPVAGDPNRVVRLRRLTIAPGGAIAWHVHDSVQGMALIVSGEMTEFRNSCMDPILYRAGDVAREDALTAHGWRNESDEPAVVLVMHVVTR